MKRAGARTKAQHLELRDGELDLVPVDGVDRVEGRVGHQIVVLGLAVHDHVEAFVDKLYV